MPIKRASPSLIALETAAVQLAENLHGDASLEGKRCRFFLFFLQIAELPEQERFRSYYLQFAPTLLPLCQELYGSSRDPEELCAWLQVADKFRRLAPEHLASIAKAEHKIRLAAILLFLYINEAGRAAALMGIEAGQAPHPPIPRLAAAQALEKRAPLPLRDDLSIFLQEWQARSRSFSASSVQTILVDSSTVSSGNAPPQGVLLALQADARERPGDAEEDRSLLNNQVYFGKHALYWTIMDGLLAARSRMAPGIARCHYTIQFSLPEKSVEVGGTSLGLAAALLAWITSRNRHYRATSARIAESAAVTGGIQPDGAVTAVASLTLAAKIRAAFFSPLERLFLPEANHAEAFRLLVELEKRYPCRHLLLQPLETLDQALQDRNLIDNIRLSPLAYALSGLRRIQHKPVAAALAATAMLVLLLALAPTLQWWHDRKPAQWTVEENKLNIENAAGERLWSYGFDCPIESPEYDYPRGRHIVLDDLDGDSRPEVLVGISSPSAPGYSGTLFGFDDRGHPLWPPLKLGRVQRNLEGMEIPDVYDMDYIKIVEIEPGQPKMILTALNSHTNFAGMLALIDLRGRIRGSYWNSSHIGRYFVHDVTGDGRREIIATLFGNEDGRARLAIFDAYDMQGASPQSTPHYTLPGIPPAHHLKLFRFPASPFVRKAYYRDMISNIEKWESGFRIYLANPGVHDGNIGIEDCDYCSYFFTSQLEPVVLFDPPDLTLSRFSQVLGRPYGAAERARLQLIEEWDSAAWRTISIGAAAAGSSSSRQFSDPASARLADTPLESDSLHTRPADRNP